MQRGPLVLILIGVLLALSNLGILSGQWIVPALMIGIGFIALVFSKQWEQVCKERRERRAHRHDDRTQTGSSA